MWFSTCAIVYRLDTHQHVQGRHAPPACVEHQRSSQVRSKAYVIFPYVARQVLVSGRVEMRWCTLQAVESAAALLNMPPRCSIR